MCAVKLNFVIEFVAWLRFNEVDLIKVHSKMFDNNRISKKNPSKWKARQKTFESKHKKMSGLFFIPANFDSIK